MENRRSRSPPRPDSPLYDASGTATWLCLDLSDTMVSDRGVYAMKSMKDMRQLDLSNTRITDRCSPFLAELWQLDTLKMAENTQVTNKGLTPLLKLKKLRSLDLGKTKVTPQAKAALQKRLSPCQVQ